MSITKTVHLLILLTALFSSILEAKTSKDGNLLDQERKAAVIDTICRLLTEKYIDLDSARSIRDKLFGKQRAGGYESVEDPVSFAQSLTDDLLEASHDHHFFIEFSPERAELIRASRSRSESQVKQARQKISDDERWHNFGFRKLERLRGNVGYLDLRSFSDPEYAGETAVAAMRFLASMDAVIIDLRNNHGGSPSMVQLLCSYFIEGGETGRTHLNSFERRHNNSLEQYWTIPYVPGKPMFDTDLYVLISHRTGSGAEEFAYNMKNLERATLIGETTHGAAHPIDAVIIEESYVMHLPTGRPVNPVSGTNWEGTGVEPEVSLPASKALDRAYMMALENLQKQSIQERVYEIDWAVDELKQRLHPVSVGNDILEKYAGNYGKRTVRFENGALYYQRTGPAYKLTPITATRFALENLDDFRIEFTTDEMGNVTGLVGLYSDGTQDRSKR